MQSYSTDKQQQIFLRIYAKCAGLKKPGWNTENVIISFIVFCRQKLQAPTIDFLF